MLQEDGEEAGIVVGVHARLARRRRWVANQLDERQRSLAEHGAEVAGLEAESGGQHVHQLVGHCAHAGEELLDDGVEPWEHVLGQPLVGAVEAEEDRLDIGRVRRVLGR